ncbi:MAG: ORF6N domain-containing protein, partial [Steroidobacteraceae bacterium]
MCPSVVNPSAVETQIHTIRGLSVMLDAKLARLYAVSTKVLLQAVRRNSKRFPEDFVFVLYNQEVETLRSQIGDGLIISVEEMTVAGNDGTQANESRRPKQDGRWVRTSP